MKDRKFIIIGAIIVFLMLVYIILQIVTGINNDDDITDNTKAEAGTVKQGTDYGDEILEDTGADPVEKNSEMRVTFLDEYKLASVIPPDCLPNTCGIMQHWLDKAFNNNTLEYNIILDDNSIEQNDIYAAFGFHIKEFPEYRFRYAHYYGTNEVYISSPQIDSKDIRFPRDE